jgi:hypothetical protein
MSSKQLALFIGITVVLALALAWTIEQAQIRRFLFEFDNWWEEKQSGKRD